MATISEAEIRARAKAALLGGLVADAATMGLHWIYKPEVLAAALEARPGSAAAPEFYEPPACPFYKAPAGDPSPYGTELYALTQYLANAPGPATQLDSAAAAKALAAVFTASTGYLNHSSKYVVAAVAEGKDKTGDPADAQANAFVKAPALVALLAGSPALLAVTEAAVRVQQDNAPAVAAGLAGAALLEKVVLGSSVADAVAWALGPDSSLDAQTQAQIKAALDLKDRPFTESVTKFGLSCGLPASLQNAVLGADKFTTFVDGVRANILAGGDNASRAALIGALLAAQAGSVEAAIPAEWRAKTTGYAKYAALADAIIARRA